MAGNTDGKPGSDLEHLKRPTSVAVLGNLSIAVGDPDNDRILIIDLDSANILNFL